MNSNLVHAMNEDDPDRRLQFCETILGKCYSSRPFTLGCSKKSAIYADKPRTVEELKLKNINVCLQIAASLCHKVCYSVNKRLEKCIEVEGGHFAGITYNSIVNKLCQD